MRKTRTFAVPFPAFLIPALMAPLWLGSCTQEKAEQEEGTTARTNLWLIELTRDQEIPESETTIGENFKRLVAEGSQEDTGWTEPEGEWTTTIDYSPGVHCLVLIETQDDEHWLRFDNEMMRAEVTDNAVVASWTYKEEETDTYSFEDYSYTRTLGNSVHVTMNLSIDGNNITGGLTSNYINTLTEIESDRWIADQYSQSDYFISYLVDYWDDTNEATSAECDGPDCRIDVSTTAIWQHGITGTVFEDPTDEDYLCAPGGGTYLGNPYN